MTILMSVKFRPVFSRKYAGPHRLEANIPHHLPSIFKLITPEEQFPCQGFFNIFTELAQVFFRITSRRTVVNDLKKPFQQISCFEPIFPF